MWHPASGQAIGLHHASRSDCMLPVYVLIESMDDRLHVGGHFLHAICMCCLHVFYLLWILLVKVLNDAFSLLIVDRVPAMHAELGKFKLFAAKFGQGAAAPCPRGVLHL